MSQTTLKVRKVKGINPQTKKEGIVARCVTNGKSSFEDICELAGLNTTMNVAELEAAGKLLHLYQGEPSNIKITRPADLIYAEAFLNSQNQ